MATTITAGNATNGAAISSDSTGILELKSGTGSGTTAMTVSTGQAVTFAQTANLPNTFGFKNRIINGAMVIDQRNASVSVAISGNNSAYSVDRWQGSQNTDGAFTLQQITDAPAGFTNSLRFTTTTADASLGATQFAIVRQAVEGFNFSDFGFGAAGASNITLSFWTKSSLTGTFGGALLNSAENRSYPFSYTINAANTWEQKTVTITGDTTGTWLTNNGVGCRLVFGLGVGSSYSSTAGTWTSTQFTYSVTGAVSVIGTLNATWQITGVQLEKGSTATSFDFRDYGTELSLCQRYFQSYTYAAGAIVTVGTTFSTSAGAFAFNFIVPFRATPSTITIPAIATSGANRWCPLTAAGGFPGTVGTATVNGSTLNHFRLDFSGFTAVYTGGGVAVSLYSSGDGLSYMTASAEL